MRANIILTILMFISLALLAAQMKSCDQQHRDMIEHH